MKAPEIRSADHLAEAIADGVALDWARIERESGIPAARLRALRLLADLVGRPPEPAPPSPIEPVPQGFTVLEEIGQGAHGQVFRARDEVLQREVALKVVRPDAFADADARARFLREARALARVEHPHVVRIHAVHEEAGQLRLALELVRGRTLAEVVREQGPLDCDAAARVGAQLAGALAAIHDVGLLHGDIKPSNAMLTADGRAVLLDFGVARDAASWSLGLLEGSPVSMAPEVHDGVEVDARADLFALGVVLWHLLTGSYPFTGRDLREIRERMREPPLLERARSGVPRALADLVLRLLAPDPEQRPASAAEVEQELRAFLGRKRRRRVLAATAALALGALAAGWFLAPGQGPPVMHSELLVLRPDGDVKLRDGDTVVDGDRLVLETEGDRPLHVYVFNEDDAGAVSCLFPLAHYEPANPLAPHVRHRLPGSYRGVQDNWSMGDDGDGEYFLVVAGADPVPEAARMAALWKTPERDDRPDLVAALGDQRGVARTRPEPPRADRGDLDVDAPALRALADQLRGRDGVLVRSIVLRHVRR